MPKIKSYTPSWLSPPAPGHSLFVPSSEERRSSPFPAAKPKAAKTTPRKTLARSGSQVFVAVGREIQWADLIELKEKWQEKGVRGRSSIRIKREDEDEPDDEECLRASAREGYAGFRTIQFPIADDIRQLVISPQADYLAVLTTHTVRIIAVPDLSYLSSPTNDIIKPKSWTLGPTTHVVDRSAVATALWHPLGVNGSALVTITTDAVVRVWELSPADRWSFDKSSLTIDLRKLADGTSLDQNFAPSNETSSKCFSADSFEMDVAAAAFAGRGAGGWSPMTLWVAMTQGDVYALCPLLPSRWAPPPTLIPSLSVAIVGNLAAIEDDPHVTPQARLLAQQQLDWMSDLDNQDPVEVNGPLGEPPVDVYTRPTRPGTVPRLQGPFELELGVESEVDMDLELTDIFVIGQKLDTDELMMGEDEELEVDDIDQEGLSLNVVCLLSSSGQLRICLDLDGVQAKWLPPKNRSKAATLLAEEEEEEEPSLLTFQTLDTLRNLEMTEDGWPMFSPDVTSRYAFYITHPSSITYVSLSPWVFRLESELRGESSQGSDFRIDLFVKGQSSTRERLYTSPNQGDTNLPLAAAVAFRDPDLGYFLLSANPYDPIAVVFEAPDEFEPMHSISPKLHQEIDTKPLDFYEPRPTFQPPHVFGESLRLPDLLDKLRTSRHKTLVNQEVRLSPVTLAIFTDAHQTLSEETYRLGTGAAELFRRLEGLQVELRQQIAKANEVKNRVEAITGEDQAHEGVVESSRTAIDRRLEAAKTRGEALSQRLERMRKTVSKATSRELSDKERAWVNEVKALDASISGSDAPVSDGPSRLKHLGRRYDEVQALKEELVSQAEKLATSSGDGEEDQVVSSPDLRIPSELRKAKLKQVQGLLERETALVDAVKTRLERMSLAG